MAAAAEALDGKLTAGEEALYQRKNRSSQDRLNLPIRLDNTLAADLASCSRLVREQDVPAVVIKGAH
ncbi:MAG TPA: hypothetical protein VMT87_03740 [Vicinamibacteria bacterium]|nr:hypothetical protein [Vicinamibacteria bacterium]